MNRTVVVDKNLRELRAHGTASFPFEVNHDEPMLFQERYIRCHWHDELELSLLMEGRAVYQVNGVSYENEAGQGMVINTDIPHMLVPAGAVSPKLLTIIVHPSILYGTLGTAVDLNVMRPYLRSRLLAGIRLDPSVSWQKEVLESMRRIDELYTAQSFAFELKIKSLLCNIFYEIILNLREQVKPESGYSAEELQRLKLLLDYLHTNYSRPLSLSELASCIHVTRESCCRFFRKMTGKTVSQYLEDYRIAQSIRLLQAGNLSIAQIADMTGFSNASRFAAAFRSRMGCAPARYRRSAAYDSTASEPFLPSVPFLRSEP